ncbi:15543_t:CDS:2 [Racocetra fulgida]|uniref:15543_t:CDS:1 n=1 Tax=Racocetra fulgida TaxID=60492 RepID=A0A9N8VC62_9GLOM|nr:15543_t:CDS:2 [Racocetra fulgida]
MDQETAQALFNKGAFLLFLNAPENKSGTSGLRSGFFKFYESKEVVIKYWDPHIEDVKKDDETDSEQIERLKLDMREFDPFLGAYPLTPPTHLEKWVNLTNYITPSLISRILPNEGKMNNVSSSTVDEDELLNIKGSSKFQEDIILFTKFDLKKSWRTGAVGGEITKYSQDKNKTISDLSTQSSSNELKSLRRRFNKLRGFLGQRFRLELSIDNDEEEGEYAPVV